MPVTSAYLVCGSQQESLVCCVCFERKYHLSGLLGLNSAVFRQQASRHGIASCPAVFGSRQGACLPYLGSKRLLIRRPVLYFPLRPRVFLTARSPPYSWTLHAQIHTMTSSSSSPPPTSFLEQTVSVISSVAGYMRLPAMASTGVAAVLTSLLYFKQK